MVFTSTAIAVTDAEWHILARKGGAYLFAIVMVQEYKQSSCGPMLNIAKKWMDLEAAQTEVVAAFPPRYRQELRGVPQLIASKRSEFQDLFADPNLPKKCAETSNFVLREFDTAVTEWRAKKAQLAR